MTTYPITRTLAGGLIVEVDCTGRAVPARCTWLVRVPNNNPEPDSIEDCYDLVDCGGRLFDDGYGSYHCEFGHELVSCDDPRRSAWEAEQAFLERRADEEAMFA